jgi:hypothetical protein
MNMLTLKSKPREFKELKGKNFMTPRVLGYFRCNDHAVELSQGEGFTRKPIYGVSVRPDEFHVLSKLFDSKSDAMEYIECLSSQIKAR